MDKSEEQLIEQLADQRKLDAQDRFEEQFPNAEPGTITLMDGPPAQCPDNAAAQRFPDLRKEDNGGSNVKQYGLPKGAIELQDLIEHRGMNFAQGNIFKAQYRAGHCSHSDELRDARKTLWFAQREVERLSNGKS